MLVILGFGGYMNKKIIFSLLLITAIIPLIYYNVYATNTLNDILGQAKNFNGSSSTGIGSTIPSFLQSDIIPIVGVIGNLVFAGVTVILGMKFIWSSAEGKASVLESLPGYVLAVILFYLASTLVTWMQGTGLGDIASASSWDTVKNSVWHIIYLIAHYGSFAGILYLGLRYMIASAEDRATLKTNFGAFLIGIIFVFCTTNVVNYIVSIGGEVFK